MRKIKYELTLIMGKPGSGKSTYIAKLVKNSLRDGRIVYASSHVLGANYFDPHFLGKYMLYDVDIIIDEAQLVWDNRNFKTFSDNMKFFISNFRHMKCRVFIVSQSYEDLDVKIRRQAHHIYIMQPSILPFFIMRQKVRIKFGINEDGTDIITMYKSSIFSYRFNFAPPLYKFFNSYDCPELPSIPIFKLWGSVPVSSNPLIQLKVKIVSLFNTKIDFKSLLLKK